MPEHFEDVDEFTNSLTQSIFNTISNEVDVLVSTDDEVYEKVEQLAKLCAKKFFSEDHLKDSDEEEEIEYCDMDLFPSQDY